MRSGPVLEHAASFRCDIRAFIHHCLWVVMVLGLSNAAASQSLPLTRARGVTLQDAVDSALSNNPDLGIARSAADSARSETMIARAWANPTISAIPNTPFQYAATLPVDLGPQRRFRVEASRLGQDAARSDIREGARQVVLAVRRAFYDVLLADAKQEIIAGRRDVVRQLVIADSARVRAGDLPERALLRSQLEGIRVEADLARAGIERTSTRLLLQGLMGVTTPDTALRVDGTLQYRDVNPDVRAIDTTVVSRRPDVLGSRIREEQSIASQHLARALVLPIPQLTYVRQLGAPFESGHYYAFGIGFELPVLNQYTGQRQRADASHHAASLSRTRVEAQARREIQVAVVEFEAQREIVRRYEAGVVGKMRDNVAAARYAYSRGSASLLEVLDAVRTEQDVLNDYSMALHDYWVAAFMLEAATGIPVR